MISHATVLKWIFRILIFVVFVMCLVDGYFDLAIVLLLVFIISFFEDYHSRNKKNNYKWKK